MRGSRRAPPLRSRSALFDGGHVDVGLRRRLRGHLRLRDERWAGGGCRRFLVAGRGDGGRTAGSALHSGGRSVALAECGGEEHAPVRGLVLLAQGPAFLTGVRGTSFYRRSGPWRKDPKAKQRRASSGSILGSSRKAGRWSPRSFGAAGSITRHAVREYPTANGPADYVLFVGGRLLGVVEAKKIAVDPQNVLVQAERYARGHGHPVQFPGLQGPVPLLHERRADLVPRRAQRGRPLAGDRGLPHPSRPRRDARHRPRRRLCPPCGPAQRSPSPAVLSARCERRGGAGHRPAAAAHPPRHGDGHGQDVHHGEPRLSPAQGRGGPARRSSSWIAERWRRRPSVPSLHLRRRHRSSSTRFTRSTASTSTGVISTKRATRASST